MRERYSSNEGGADSTHRGLKRETHEVPGRGRIERRGKKAKSTDGRESPGNGRPGEHGGKGPKGGPTRAQRSALSN